MTKPTTTPVMVATRPGSIKEWFRIYLPMPVVPERSKLMAAMRVPLRGQEKVPVHGRPRGGKVLGRDNQTDAQRHHGAGGRGLAKEQHRSKKQAKDKGNGIRLDHSAQRPDDPRLIVLDKGVAQPGQPENANNGG